MDADDEWAHGRLIADSQLFECASCRVRIQGTDVTHRAVSETFVNSIGGGRWRTLCGIDLQARKPFGKAPEHVQVDTLVDCMACLSAGG